MYIPPAFREDDPAALHAIMREAGLSTLVTTNADGIVATPLPMILNETEGPFGTLYGHVARANPQWQSATEADALVIFAGPDAYISPSWYAAKREHGKVVPTWNYVAVHAYGPAEFFTDASRLRHVVSRLTSLYEAERAEPWTIEDAPEDFVERQLRLIAGVRVPIARIEGKRKMSQNRPEADRAGVAAGLLESPHERDHEVASLIPTTQR